MNAHKQPETFAKCLDLSAVQSDSIAKHADNIELFSSVQEAHREEMCQR